MYVSWFSCDGSLKFFKIGVQEQKKICQLRHQLLESDTFSAVPAWNTSAFRFIGPPQVIIASGQSDIW